MKESYICKNNNVFINDISDNGVNVIERPYQDNIEEILKIENIIEALENQKESYKESIKIKKGRINHKKKKNTSIIIASIIVGLLTMLISFFVNPFLNANILLAILTTLGSFSLLSSTFFKNLKCIKTLKKELDGINLSNEILEIKQKEAKKLLIQLEKDKTSSKLSNESSKLKRVNYLTQLKELKYLLGLYCSIGANESEFKKYYKEGTLSLNLSNSFSKEDIAEIKRFLKTKK